MFDYINPFLRNLSFAESQFLYNCFLGVGCVFNFLSTRFLTKKFQGKSNHCNLYALFCVIAGIAASKFSLGTENGSFLPSSGNSVALYVIFCLIIAFVLKIPFLYSLDISIPSYIGARGGVIIGCSFAGCCHGMAVEWGIYSRAEGINVFPCNQIESILCLLIWLIAVEYAKAKQYEATGKIGAFVLFMFALMRFGTDLFRDNIKLFGQSSYDGIMGIIMAVVAIITLFILERNQPRINNKNNIY